MLYIAHSLPHHAYHQSIEVIKLVIVFFFSLVWLSSAWDILLKDARFFPSFHSVHTEVMVCREASTNSLKAGLLILFLFGWIFLDSPVRFNKLWNEILRRRSPNIFWCIFLGYNSHLRKWKRSILQAFGASSRKFWYQCVLKKLLQCVLHRNCFFRHFCKVQKLFEWKIPLKNRELGGWSKKCNMCPEHEPEISCRRTIWR